MTAFAALLRRELLRLIRQPARIVAAVATPLLLLIVLGGGFAGSFAPTGTDPASYASFLVPGSIVMSVLFAGIFNAIALIEDRDKGLLRGMLVGPTPMPVFVGARLLVGAGIGFGQSLVLVAAWRLAGDDLDLARLPLLLAAVLAVAAGVQSICLAAGWLTKSTAGFHTVMNTVLMPAWLLGGAFFPVDSAAGWVRWLALANPMSWLIDLVRLAGTGVSRLAEPQTTAMVGVAVAALAVAASFATIRRYRS